MPFCVSTSGRPKVGVVQSLRDQLVTDAADTIDIDVGCCRESRETFDFVASSWTSKLERYGFSIGG